MSFKNIAEEKVHVESVSGGDALGYSEEVAHQGALLMEEERHLGIWASVKLHRRPLLICEQASPQLR